MPVFDFGECLLAQSRLQSFLGHYFGLDKHPRDEFFLILFIEVCMNLNRPIPVITERVVRQLQAYDWPGNVRELHNVMERAAIVSQDSKLVVELAAEDLGQAIVLAGSGIERIGRVHGNVPDFRTQGAGRRHAAEL